MSFPFPKFQLLRIGMRWLFIACLFAGMLTRTASSADDLGARWRATFILHCANNFKWPASRSADAKFIIGVAGNDDVLEVLERDLAGKQIDRKPIVVMKVSPSDARNCRIVYVGPNARLSSFVSQARGNGVLVVGEDSDDAMVWFTTRKGELTAKGNKAAMDAEGLNCNIHIGRILFTK